MNFIRNNSAYISIGFTIACIMAMAAFLGVGFRGGQEWLYQSQFDKIIHWL